MLPKRKHAWSASGDLTSNNLYARDEDLVYQARSLLGLLDFEFFRLAWRNWHGGEPDDQRLEPGFMTFLFERRAPDYVRHFARLVMRRAADGCLDPAEFGIEDEPEIVPPSACLPDEFASTSLWVVIGLLLIVAF